MEATACPQGLAMAEEIIVRSVDSPNASVSSLKAIEAQDKVIKLYVVTNYFR